VVASASTHVPQDGAGVTINDEPLLDTKPCVYPTPAAAGHAHHTQRTRIRHTQHGTHTHDVQGSVA
jgi:hypothetical protein